jgi:hypothetical protein
MTQTGGLVLRHENDPLHEITAPTADETAPPGGWSPAGDETDSPGS